MRHRTKLSGIVLILLSLSLCHCSGVSKKGYLLIVGGGHRPVAALQKFVALCDNGPILVITAASAEPFEAGSRLVKEFRNSGATDVSWLHIETPDAANADSTLAQINRCRGIFFSGGVQQRLMQRLGGTRAESAIRTIYANGGIIGGTSAGAAVMSRIMITGNELVHKDSTDSFSTIQSGNIETQSGFGFVDQAIIDQHFVKRKRNNRLISCILEHPEWLGIGIDESTAILLHPDNHFVVYGIGTVLIYDARKAHALSIDGNGLLRGRGVRMHVLTEGETFTMN